MSSCSKAAAGEAASRRTCLRAVRPHRQADGCAVGGYLPEAAEKCREGSQVLRTVQKGDDLWGEALDFLFCSAMLYSTVLGVNLRSLFQWRLG